MARKLSNSVETERQIFVLYDGMSGEAAGEVASRLTVKQISASFMSDPSIVEVQSQTKSFRVGTLVRSAIQVANRTIL